jgi:hypothetical protein
MAAMKQYPINFRAFIFYVLSITLGIQSLYANDIGLLPEHALSCAVYIDCGNSVGSGFFYTTTNNLFLVTAKHVLYQKDDSGGISTNLIANDIAVFYFDPAQVEKAHRREMRVNLVAASSNNVIRTSKTSDAVVIRIGIHKGDMLKAYYDGSVSFPDQGTIPIATEDNTERYGSVSISSDIFLAGYPRSIGIDSKQIDYDLPLLRKGIVAGKNPNSNTIIIDCPAYPGNSGGPVFVNAADSFKLIGIVVEFVPFREVWENRMFHYFNEQISNSGYAVVVPIDSILDTVW